MNGCGDVRTRDEHSSKLGKLLMIFLILAANFDISWFDERVWSGNRAMEVFSSASLEDVS